MTDSREGDGREKEIKWKVKWTRRNTKKNEEERSRQEGERSQ